MGDFELAIATSQECLTFDPSNQKAMYRKAQALAKVGDGFSLKAQLSEEEQKQQLARYQAA